MKSKLKPLILVLSIVVLLAMLVITPVKTQASTVMYGVPGDGKFGWTCYCPLTFTLCGCAIIDPSGS